MNISPELSGKIQTAINEFISNPKPSPMTGEKFFENWDLREIVSELNVLPVTPDWFSYWGIQPNGNVISFNAEKPYDIKTITNQKIINVVLFDVAKNCPDLAELMPVRNPESIICPGCDGTGILKEFADHEFLAKSIRCNCGGVGWLPSADPKHLYF